MSVTPHRDRRRIARVVRRLMGPDEMTTKALNDRIREVASEAGVDRTTVHRMCTGGVLPEQKNLIAVLVELGATPKLLAEVKVMHKAARHKAMAPLDHAELMNAGYVNLRLNERDAWRARTVSTTMITGLLQPPVYVEAVAKRQAPLVAEGLRSAWESSAGDEREARQALLYTDERRRLELHAVICRAALVQGYGGPKVMGAVYDRLITAAAEPNITIQVLRERLDSEHIPITAPFTIHEFDDDPELPYEAYVESQLGTLDVREANGLTQTLLSVWRSAAESAMTPDESIAYIEELRNKVEAKIE
jgi:hypothetical protein